jgi:Fe2+ or Zn2+ uptake regulation protein
VPQGPGYQRQKPAGPLTPGQVQAARDLRAAGLSVREIGQLLGNGKPVSRQTVYRALGMLAT